MGLTKTFITMRTKNLISYPKYNRVNGDLTRKWYVEFSYRLPSDEELHRYRIYAGLCSGTAKQRDEIAEKLIAYYTKYLKSGEYLHQEPNLNPLKETESHRPEQQKWMREKKSIMLDTLIQRYIEYLKPNLRKKTLHVDTNRKVVHYSN